MTAHASRAATPPVASLEAQAAALWSFVHLRTPSFSSSDALAVATELSPSTDEDVKSLAKRLRHALRQHGVPLKHTHALDAAARLLGHTNWHVAARQPTTATLQFVARFADLGRRLLGWDEAIQLFADFCEGDIEGGGMQVYQLAFTPNSLTLDSPMLTAQDEFGRQVPLMQVQWDASQPRQLGAAISAVETLRRRYEETGRGLIDGLAAAHYCLRTPHSNSEPDDPVNSELVVMDVTEGPDFGEEIGRGDEVTCWSELAGRHQAKDSSAYVLEGSHWLVGNNHYEWHLTTIRASDVVPTIISRPLTTEESARLFRRHHLAIGCGRTFVQEDRVKRLSAVSVEAQGVDVDWEFVRSLAFGKGRIPPSELIQTMNCLSFRKRLSVNELLRLAGILGVSRPSDLIRKPKRSELALLQDDHLLRTFVSRIHDVVYEVPRRMGDVVVSEVDSAVSMFVAALRKETVTETGVTYDSFPRLAPYLSYANRGKRLLATLKRLGLVAYAGLTTNIQSLRNDDYRVIGSAQFKVERVLFLDIDFEEQAQ
ncbi:glyoxalase superfamily protein [Cupriavidus basilensis]|uniref:glyoxalase superfamily protein n=1 Tax=Cupriavidus basilensis TaxID=68895 RepID=UPI00157A21B6|nr:glyoxalase superfamily protein [Cupriavidus basilensis]NUA30555.1 hypothetical protein [Cupriavidus basilensis]